MGVVGRRCLCEDTLPVQGIDTGSVYGPSAVVKWKKRRVDAVDGIDLVDGGCGARGGARNAKNSALFLKQGNEDSSENEVSDKGSGGNESRQQVTEDGVVCPFEHRLIDGPGGTATGAADSATHSDQCEGQCEPDVLVPQKFRFVGFWKRRCGAHSFNSLSQCCVSISRSVDPASILVP